MFALVSKQTGTYRLFCADGRVLCATLAGSALAGWGRSNMTGSLFAAVLEGRDRQ